MVLIYVVSLEDEGVVCETLAPRKIPIWQSSRCSCFCLRYENKLTLASRSQQRRVSRGGSPGPSLIMITSSLLNVWLARSQWSLYTRTSTSAPPN